MPKDDERATTLRVHLLAADVTRADLHKNDDHRKHLTFHDLRATGITWAAVRGDNPLRIKQRAGHSGFATTEMYVAENLGRDSAHPFPSCRPSSPGVSVPFRRFGSKTPQKHPAISGADGDRTRDLMHAMHALSQLSYGPEREDIPTRLPPSVSRFFTPRAAPQREATSRLRAKRAESSRSDRPSPAGIRTASPPRVARPRGVMSLEVGR